MGDGKASVFVIYTYMTLMLVVGAANGFLLKLQDVINTEYGYFMHPFFQCFTMFLAELLCLLVFILQKRFLKEKEGAVQEEGAKLNPVWYSIPAFCDFFGSSLGMFGMNFTAPSVVQMMSGALILFVAILSKVFLKRQFYRHHWTAVGITIAGILIVAFDTIIESTDTKSSDQTPTLPIGIIFMLCSYVVMAIQLVVEEKIFAKFVVHPLQAVGFEGAFGALYFLFFLPIFQFIPAERIRIDSKGHDLFLFGKVEDCVVAFAQLGVKGSLVVALLGAYASLAIFNFVGQAVTKYVSAASRSTITTLRTVLVWAISLIIGWEDFLWPQLIGFILVTLGVFIFNEILVIPWLGFNTNTRSAIQKRGEVLTYDGHDDDLLSTSGKENQELFAKLGDTD